MNTSTDTLVRPPRTHSITAPIFKTAESRHFSDEEMSEILKVFPDLGPQIEAAKEIREKDVAIISRVVKEIYSQYPYEEHHEYASAKCPRDIRYVVAYAVHSMISGESRWFEDKLLIWLKTILQAFDFPARNKSAASALFIDEELEEKLKTLPQKAQSIYHTYYRLKQEMGKTLKPEHYTLIAPYLDVAINSLSEDY